MNIRVLIKMDLILKYDLEREKAHRVLFTSFKFLTGLNYIGAVMAL